jgi:hypothetical protein
LLAKLALTIEFTILIITPRRDIQDFTLLAINVAHGAALNGESLINGDAMLTALSAVKPAIHFAENEHATELPWFALWYSREYRQTADLTLRDTK